MSLEDAILANTIAIDALTQAIHDSIVLKKAGAEVVGSVEIAKEPKARKETVKAAEPAPELPNEKQPDTSSASEPSEPESAPVSYDDVKKATNALSAAKGRDVTIATLAVFNVQKATQLVGAQWAEYVAYATKVAEEA